MPITKPLDDGLIAAIDLGSNSFHMAVAKLEHGHIRVVDSLSEKVQLAAGLDGQNNLTAEAFERGLACLSRFNQHLVGVAPDRIRIVATNALRVAKNAKVFAAAAQAIIDHPIEVIAGREEARLIYLGVAQTSHAKGRRLVVDIGGGSTEFIIGKGIVPRLTESLHMGCVSFTQRYFADGKISAKSLDRAILAARQEIAGIAPDYLGAGWDCAIGSSGTIKAVRGVLQSMGLASPDGCITADGLMQLRQVILRAAHTDELDLPGLKEDRKPILPAGFAIISAIFQSFCLQEMAYSDGALREGVLYDLIGRHQPTDVRVRTLNAMQKRFGIDQTFATRVADTAADFFEQLRRPLSLQDEHGELLLWAAEIHEIGKTISHSSYHKHGAYLMLNADLPGFSKPQQESLSLMIGSHRRRLRKENIDALVLNGGETLLHLTLILRLAVLLHHSRSSDTPSARLRCDGQHYRLEFAKGWLAEHPLTLADLEQEADHFEAAGFLLSYF